MLNQERRQSQQTEQDVLELETQEQGKIQDYDSVESPGVSAQVQLREVI